MKYLLPTLLSYITGPREIITPQWSKKSLVYNLFRVWELVFGRNIKWTYGAPDTIHPEAISTPIIENGKVVRVIRHFFTWEALTVHIEQMIFESFKHLSFAPFKVQWVQLVPAGNAKLAHPYVLAIAFDTITSNTASPTSFSHTVSGSNPALVPFYAAAGTDPSTVTYASVGLSKKATATVPTAGDPVSVWATATLPSATGSNTLASSGGLPVGVQAISYSGVGAITNANSGTGGTNGISVTYTVTVANSFVVSSGYGRNGPHALAASTGIVNDRYGLTTSGICSCGDTDSVSVNTLTRWSNAGSPNPNDNAQVGLVLEPSGAAAGAVVISRRTRMGIGR
jgi:hypothetical protein